MHNVKNVQMDRDLLFAQSLPEKKGYTWTLTSRMGEMLVMAEEKFGPRDKSYTILGIEVGPHEYPQIWFPEWDGNNKNIIIQIERTALKDRYNAYYQVAHEVIHTLAPVHGEASNLEEGVATYFAVDYMKTKFPNENRMWINEESYREVYDKVKDSLDKNPCCIKTLRKQYPAFYDIPKQQLSTIFTDVDCLLKPFERKQKR